MHEGGEGGVQVSREGGVQVRGEGGVQEGGEGGVQVRGEGGVQVRGKGGWTRCNIVQHESIVSVPDMCAQIQTYIPLLPLKLCQAIGIYAEYSEYFWHSAFLQ